MQNIISILWEKGLSNSVYDAFGMISIVAAYLFCAIFGKKYGIRVRDTLIVISIVLIIAFFSIHIIIIDAVMFLKEHSSVPGLIMTSLVRVLLLIPMIALWLSKIIKIQWKKLCDLLAFLPLIIGGIGAFGCIFAGCCYGHPCSWGIYNPLVEAKVFPVQILNAIIMLGIGVFLYLRAKRSNFAVDGLSYPLMLTLFGATRFLTEFLCDNDKVVFGCSVLAIHSVKNLVVGIIVVLVIRYKAKK